MTNALEINIHSTYIKHVQYINCRQIVSMIAYYCRN